MTHDTPEGTHMGDALLTVTDADHHTMETFFAPTQGEHAGQESKCMEIRYSRRQ